MKFNELGLIAPILKALTAQGYAEPTPIQRQAIPLLTHTPCYSAATAA